MIYVICLDTPGPGDRAAQVERWLDENIANVLHPLPQCWIVDAPLAAQQIRTALLPFLTVSDRLLIIKAATEAVWYGLPTGLARDLADHFPGSITERIPGKTEGVAG